MARRGGVVNPQSGAGWSRKNDGRTKGTLVEFKRTDKKQITLKAIDLRDLENHALAEGRTFELGFEVGGKHYVVLSEADYLSRVADTKPAPRVVLERKVSGSRAQSPRKSFLLQRDREAGGSEDDLPRDTRKSPRSLSGGKGVPGVRNGNKSHGGMGRNNRSRAQQSKEDEET